MIKEEWRPAIYVDRHGNVYDYTGKYEVSNLGNVRSYPKKTYGGIRILKQSHTKEGYAHVSLCYNGKIKTCNVQILVAYAFPEICGDWFVGCGWCVGHARMVGAIITDWRINTGGIVGACCAWGNASIRRFCLDYDDGRSCDFDAA